MNVKHKDQILFLPRASIFKVQVTVKTGKLTPLLTHLRYTRQNLNRNVNVKTLRPLETYILFIVQNKTWQSNADIETAYEPTQKRLLRYSDPLRHLKSTILPQRQFRQMILVFLEAVSTTCTQNFILTTQKIADSDVCKIFFQPY